MPRQKTLDRLTQLFPFWAMAVCVFALLMPASLQAHGNAIVPLLMLNRSAERGADP